MGSDNYLDTCIVGEWATSRLENDVGKHLGFRIKT